MSGYHNFSMSNNAVNAYQEGGKPMSKWTKQAILDELIREGIDTTLLSKIPAKGLKNALLIKSSWHHTSSRFNRTDFFSVNLCKAESMNPTEMAELCEKKEGVQPATKKDMEVWECSFLVWGGSRKHPTSTVHTEVGDIVGSWFFRKDGTKKSTKANGFQFIKKI